MFDLINSPIEIHFDDTMKIFHLVGRFDLIATKPYHSQLLLDMRHKWWKEESKPLGYFHMSDEWQARNMITNALALYALLHYKNVEKALNLDICECFLRDNIDEMINEARKIINKLISGLKMKRLFSEAIKNETI